MEPDPIRNNRDILPDSNSISNGIQVNGHCYRHLQWV